MTADRTPEFAAGQVWRSKKLRDYRVTLVRRLIDDAWLVKPAGQQSRDTLPQIVPDEVALALDVGAVRG